MKNLFGYFFEANGTFHRWLKFLGHAKSDFYAVVRRHISWSDNSQECMKTWLVTFKGGKSIFLCQGKTMYSIPLLIAFL